MTEQLYDGPVLVSRRTFTGDRISEEVVEQNDIRDALRNISRQTVTPTTSAKAQIKAEWRQWAEDRKRKFAELASQ